MHLITTFGFCIALKAADNVKNIDNLVNGKARDALTKNEDTKSRRRKSDLKFTTTKTSSENIIHVSQLVSEFHIEYEPVPLYGFKIDCIFWDTVAKIYTEDSAQALKTVEDPHDLSTRWVVFSVHHLTELNEDQLSRLFDHEITYRIFPGRNKFPDRVKKDKVTTFYFPDGGRNIGQDEFLEIYPIDSRKSDFSKTRQDRVPLIVKDNEYGDFSVTSYVEPVPDSIHENKFRKTITLGSVPLQIENSDMDDVSKVKQKSDKNLKNLEYKIVIKANVLFSDMGVIEYYKNVSQIPGISKIFIYVQCDDILPNEELRSKISPISINMNKLSNFPDEILIDHGFKYFYAKCEFVNRVIDTPSYNLDKTIRLGYIKTFSINEFHPEQLISFLATNVLLVWIIGVRNTETDEGGKDMNKNVLEGNVVLGVAAYSLLELLKGCCEVKLTNSLCHPFAFYSDDDNNFLNTNYDSPRLSWQSSPLTADIFSTLNTTMKIRVRSAIDLRKVHRQVIQRPHILNRMFLIFMQAQVANYILEEISAHNDTILKATQSDNNLCDRRTGKVPNDLVTGFAIDCLSTFYIFLEGQNTGYLSKMWKKTMHLFPEQGNVYYDSEYLFPARLYEEFVTVGGILKIKISVPIDQQLREWELYIGKKKWSLYAKAFRKLGLIKLTSTMKSLSQSHLFPSAEILKAFIEDKNSL